MWVWREFFIAKSGRIEYNEDDSCRIYAENNGKGGVYEYADGVRRFTGSRKRRRMCRS